MQYIIWFVLLITCHAEKSLKVDIYPGFGWDHLRFLEMNPVFDLSNFNDSDLFQSCIEMIPIHENRIELDSTVIDLFDSRTTDGSSNILIGGSAGFGKLKIGGSFSREHQTIKKEQGEQKTVTLRNQIDYLMVDVILKSSCPLNPQFINDTIEIARYQATGESLKAVYAAQIFVKKYGTHFTSRLHLGGSIMEEDFIAYSNFNRSDSDVESYKLAAKVSFLETFKLNFSYGSSQNETELSSSMNQISRKIISSKGGDVFILGGHMEAWQASVKQNPAIIRRATEDMTSILQSHKIPELTETALSNVRQKIKEAIDTYVEMNIIRGCTKRNTPMFNWVANFDDGSCDSTDEKMQFGGFIRTCFANTALEHTCTFYENDNYYSGSDRCPSGFNQYPLHTSDESESLYRTECRDCGFLWLDTCCKKVYIGHGQRWLNLYACHKNVPSSSGSSIVDTTYLFGGSFTSRKVNPVTNAFKCPEGFAEAYKLGDIKICLAERISTYRSTLPRYGGMYTCSRGNMALNSIAKECPRGYSAYAMGSIDGNCLLEVCLKFENFDNVRQLQPVALPPYFSIDSINETAEIYPTIETNSTNETDSVGLNNPRFKIHQSIDNEIFTKTFNDQYKTEAHIFGTSKFQKLELGLSIGALFVGVLALTIIGIIQMKKYRRRRMFIKDDIKLTTIKTSADA